MVESKLAATTQERDLDVIMENLHLINIQQQSKKLTILGTIKKGIINNTENTES